MRKAYLLLLVALFVGAHVYAKNPKADDDDKDEGVEPIAECIEPPKNGSITICFGWNNIRKMPLTIGRGKGNKNRFVFGARLKEYLGHCSSIKVEPPTLFEWLGALLEAIFGRGRARCRFKLVIHEECTVYWKIGNRRSELVDRSYRKRCDDDDDGQTVAPTTFTNLPEIVRKDTDHDQPTAFVPFIAMTNNTAATIASDCSSSICAGDSADASGYYPIGETLVNFRAFVAGAPVAQSTLVVAITDKQPPVITCPASTSFDLSTFTEAKLRQWASAVSASDNSGTVSISPDPATLSSALPAGVHSFTFVATDPSENQASCTADITIIDDVPPELGCPAPVEVGTTLTSAVVRFTVGVSKPLVAVTVNPDATVTFNGDSSQFTVTLDLPVGSHTVTVVGVAANSKQSACDVRVRVRDLAPPVVECPSVETWFSTDPDQPTYKMSALAPVVTDNVDPSPDVTVSIDGQSPVPLHLAFPQLFGLGPHTVLFTATDASLNSNSCQVSFTVKDTQIPRPNCPTTLTLSAELGVDFATNIRFSLSPWDNVAIDGSPSCALGVATSNPNEFVIASLPIGKTSVECTVKDTSLNVGQCTFVINIEDTQPPVFTSCPPRLIVDSVEQTVTLPLTGKDFSVSVVDNDRLTSLTYTRSDNIAAQCDGSLAGTCVVAGSFPLGETFLTFVAKDASGLTATCETSVVVNDIAKPTMELTTAFSLDLTRRVISAAVTVSADDNSDAFEIYYTRSDENDEIRHDVYPAPSASRRLLAISQQFDVEFPFDVSTSTTVTVYVADGAGNIVSDQFTVQGDPCVLTSCDPGQVCSAEVAQGEELCIVDVCYDYCENGGSCTRTKNTPSCTCPDGFSGAQCETDLCLGYCYNDGSCHATAEGLSCSCLDGFWGDRCQDSACDGACLNGGSCAVVSGSAQCSCPPGFFGADCGASVCDDHCQNGGVCSHPDGSPQCSCPEQYYGTQCESDHCAGYCYNGGVCDFVNGATVCSCPDGFIGSQCETNVCADYCQNDGSCRVSDNLPTCSCQSGFSGDQCEEDMCAGLCKNGGECVRGEALTCSCAPGFSGETCEDENKCITRGVVCQNGGVCEPESGICIGCDAPFTGDVCDKLLPEPVAKLLVTPEEMTGCDTNAPAVLNGEASTGTSYSALTWSLESSSAADTSVIEAILTAAVGEEQVHFTAGDMEFGATYVFKLTLTDPIGRSSSATAEMKRVTFPAPQIEHFNVPSTVFRGDDLSLSVSVEPSACYDPSQLTFSWHSSPPVEIANAQSANAYVPRFNLTATLTYRFYVTVAIPHVPSVQQSAPVYVDFRAPTAWQKTVVTKLNPFPEAEDQVTFLLQMLEDPDDIGMLWEWECISTDYEFPCCENCVNFYNDPVPVTVPWWAMHFGRNLWRVYVRSALDPVNKWFYRDFEFWPRTSTGTPFWIELYCETVIVNTQEQVVCEAYIHVYWPGSTTGNNVRLMEAAPSGYSYRWREVSGLGVAFTDPTSRSLKLPANSLRPNREYVFDVEVIELGTGRKTSKNVTISTFNNAPTSSAKQALVVAPGKGEAMSTKFLLKAQGWHAPDNAQLTYAFKYTRKDGSAEVSIADRLSSPSTFAFLPAGDIDVVLYVYHPDGSYARAVHSVHVDGPADPACAALKTIEDIFNYQLADNKQPSLQLIQFLTAYFADENQKTARSPVCKGVDYSAKLKGLRGRFLAILAKFSQSSRTSPEAASMAQALNTVVRFQPVEARSIEEQATAKQLLDQLISALGVQTVPGVGTNSDHETAKEIVAIMSQLLAAGDCDLLDGSAARLYTVFEVLLRKKLPGVSFELLSDNVRAMSSRVWVGEKFAITTSDLVVSFPAFYLEPEKGNFVDVKIVSFTPSAVGTCRGRRPSAHAAKGNVLMDATSKARVDGVTVSNSVHLQVLSETGDVVPTERLARTTPIKFTFARDERLDTCKDGELTCAWWDPAIQAYNSDGCTTSLTSAGVECSCSHAGELAVVRAGASCMGTAAADSPQQAYFGLAAVFGVVATSGFAVAAFWIIGRRASLRADVVRLQAVSVVAAIIRLVLAVYYVEESNMGAAVIDLLNVIPFVCLYYVAHQFYQFAQLELSPERQYATSKAAPLFLLFKALMAVGFVLLFIACFVNDSARDAIASFTIRFLASMLVLVSVSFVAYGALTKPPSADAYMAPVHAFLALSVILFAESVGWLVQPRGGSVLVFFCLADILFSLVVNGHFWYEYKHSSDPGVFKDSSLITQVPELPPSSMAVDGDEV